MRMVSLLLTLSACQSSGGEDPVENHGDTTQPTTAVGQSWSDVEVIYIHLLGSSIEGEGEGEGVTGSVATITAPGTFMVDGTLSRGLSARGLAGWRATKRAPCHREDPVKVSAYASAQRTNPGGESSGRSARKSIHRITAARSRDPVHSRMCSRGAGRRGMRRGAGAGRPKL